MNCSESHTLLVDRLTAGMEKSAGMADRVEIGNDLDRHLASCAGCRALLEDMNASLAQWKSDQPWAPPESYWNNLLPRIHERIAERERRRSNPFARIMSLARWFAVPAAALTVILVMTNKPSPAVFPTSQEIVAAVRALPADELTPAFDHNQWEGQFTSIAPDTSSLAMTEDDQAELADLLHDEDTQLSGITLNVTPLGTIQSESVDSDDALFASADDVFDAIQPRLEQSIAAIQY